MKIRQDAIFQPIKIILETAEEAEAFWAILNATPKDQSDSDALACRISNWFSEHAQMGGKQPPKNWDGTPKSSGEST